MLLVEQNALMALDVAQRGYVMETGRIALQGLRPSSGRYEQVRKTYLGEVARDRRGAAGKGDAGSTPTRASATGDAVRHLEGARDGVARHEPERPRGDGVAASRNDDLPEPSENRLAPGPVGEREQRMAHASRAVGGERALVGCRGSLCDGDELASARAERVEQRAVRVVRRVRERPRQRVDEHGGAAVPNGRCVAPLPQREPERGRADVIGLSGSRGRCGPIHGTRRRSRRPARRAAFRAGRRCGRALRRGRPTECPAYTAVAASVRPRSPRRCSARSSRQE